MNNENQNLPEKDIRQLLEENLAMTKEIKEMTRYIKRYLLWEQVFSFVKILIFIIPLVIAYFYLSPLLKEVIKQYQGILQIGQVGNQINSSGINLNNLPPEILKYLK